MEELQKNGMMAFAMVARHFLTPEELVAMLTKDSDFSESQAKLLVRQVEGKDYNPPKRDRVLAWQKEQEFPICPNPEDPDSCNVYKDLNFPDHVYEHIQDYVEQ
jgi:hypothetical protein